MSQPFGANSDSSNPFAAPNTSFETPQRPATKPTMATVFGILNLVFGGFSLMGQAFGLIMMFFLREKIEAFAKQSIQDPGPLTWIASFIGFLLTIWLIYSGIRVLSGTMAGRGSFIAYCVGSLIIRPFVVAISLIAQFGQMQQQLAQAPGGAAGLPQGAFLVGIVIGATFGLLFAEVYEAIGFFVMRSKNVTQQFEAWDAVVDGRKSNQTFDFN